MLPSDSGFEAAMRSLSSLVESASGRRAANLARLAQMTARNDHIDFTPSPEPSAAPNRSIPPPMPSREPEPDPLRELLNVQRTTRGGPFGASILSRVAENYGLR